MLTYDVLLHPGLPYRKTLIQAVSIMVPRSPSKIDKNEWKPVYHDQEILPDVSGK